MTQTHAYPILIYHQMTFGIDIRISEAAKQQRELKQCKKATAFASITFNESFTRQRSSPE